MKKNRFKESLIGLAVMSIISFAACDKDEPNNNGEVSFEHNGHKYLIVQEKKTWADAAADAVKRGGYLVEIDDQAEQDAVYSQIKKQVSATYTQAPDGGGVAYVWIGGTDQHGEGSWVWNGANKQSGNFLLFWLGNKSGVSSGYNNWGAGEPDNYTDSSVSPSGQDYAAIGLEGWPKGGSGSLGSAGQWNDISGSNQLYYVVEIATATE